MVSFSDDFETGDLTRWTQQTATAPTVQGGVVKTGSWAMDSTTGGIQSATQKNLGANLKSLISSFWFRASVLPQNAGDRFSFYGPTFDSGIGNYIDYVALLNVGGTTRFDMTIPNAPSDNTVNDIIVAVDTWYYVTLEIAAIGAPGIQRLYINNVPKLDITEDNNLNGATIGWLALGTTFASNPIAGDLYFDDFNAYNDLMVGVITGNATFH